MLLCIMAVTASAANFIDEDKIVNSKAVVVLTDLNIMQGKDDGSFDPAGSISRAEMCKMISIALNGGKEPEFGTVTCSYPDVGDHWAAGYIEYCSNLGIVAGRGDGNFDPDGIVTGTQAAKMLLVAIGYDASIEGFTGSDWAIAVNVRADQKDFYVGLEDQAPSAALTRDEAAQIVYNALSAVTVRYEYKITSVNGELQAIPVLSDDADSDTILSKKFNVIP
jgi:hypothetical protein